MHSESQRGAPGCSPFEPLDKACVAAASGAHGLSNAPTWELHLRGTVAPEALRRAVAALAVVYPWVGAVITPRSGPAAAARQWQWSWQAEAPVDAMVRAHDLRGQGEGAVVALGDHVRDRYLDLEAGPGLRLDLATLDDNRAVLWIQQHHALADGRAMIALLARLFALLTVASGGDAVDPASLLPAQRRSELDAAGLGAAARLWQTLRGAGLYARGIARALRLPLTPLRQHGSLDYRGGNRTLHLDLGAARERALRAAAAAVGANLHAALAAAWIVANVRWNAEVGVAARRVTLASIVELRPRQGAFDSFANHLGWAIPDVDLRRLGSLDDAAGRVALLREVHAQLRAQTQAGEPLARSLFERVLLALPTLAALRTLLVAPTHPVVSLNFSNVLAIAIPPLQAAGAACTEVRVTTPVSPRYGVILTATRYGERATLNVNFKDSVVEIAAAERLAQLLDLALDELRG